MMILHLGGDAVAPVEDVIVIMSMKSAMQSDSNREFIKTAKEKGFVKYLSDDPPKSLILAEINKKTVLFLSPISSETLLRRSEYPEDIVLMMDEDKEDLK